MQKLCILGSTGSIGTQTLAYLTQVPTVAEVYALAAHTNEDKMFEQIVRFSPRFALLFDADAAHALQQRVRAHQLDTKILSGTEGLLTLVTDEAVDTVLCAMMGAVGTLPFIRALEAGKRVLLANKEALLLGGAFFASIINRTPGASLIPLDSEHHALFSCLKHPDITHYPLTTPANGIKKLTLTASGGPFRTADIATLAQVTVEEACAHPTWSMGKKISIDSATLMNKALELIEAHYLFGVPAEKLDVLVHPQSFVHGMIAFDDGTILSAMSTATMQIPIASALHYPQMAPSTGTMPAFPAALTFAPVDETRFSALALVKSVLAAAELGKNSAVIDMNAANEVAVSAFIAGQLRFVDIVPQVQAFLQTQTFCALDTLEAVLERDTHARTLMATHLNFKKENIRSLV